MSSFEVDFKDRTVWINEVSLLRLQAVWRGAVVRQRLSIIQREYITVLEEIEKKPQLQVSWKNSTVCRPVFSHSCQPGITVVSECKPIKVKSHRAHRQVHVSDAGAQTAPELPQHEDSSHWPVATTTDTPDIPADTHMTAASGEASLKHSGSGKVYDIELEERLQAPASGLENVAGGPCHQPDVSQAVNAMSDKHRLLSGISEKHDAGVVPELTAAKVDTQISGDDKAAAEAVEKDWASMNVLEGLPLTELDDGTIKVDRKVLLEERNRVAMELLWTQQAINSRKQYLRVCRQMTAGIGQT